MFAKNVANFLLNMVKEGQLTIDRADEIVDGTLVTQGGAVVNERVKALLS